MRFNTVLVALTSATVLSFTASSYANGNDGAKATKPLTKCPRHYSKHKDDLGHLWCMDSAGANYTPDNARYVAHLAMMKAKPEKRISVDLAKR